MMSLYSELSLGAQASYAELFDMAMSAGTTALRGSFHRRTIKGCTYIYFNFRDMEGRVCSVYVGPESSRVQQLFEAFESAAASKLRDAMARRANACIALGCSGMLNKHFKIIDKLAAYGLFLRGSVLIGDHALLALGNMLGVRWVGLEKSLDDTSAPADAEVLVAVPADGIPQARETVALLEMGQLPMRAASHFLAADCSHVIRASKLGIASMQAPFVSFLLERPASGVVFSKAGARTVNLPDPARFAVYLLASSAARSADGKDHSFGTLEQAAALIAWHRDQGRFGNLLEAWCDGLRLGANWRQLAAKGKRLLSKSRPDLVAALSIRRTD